MTTCPLCKAVQLELPDELAMQACLTCAATLELTPMPEPIRRRMPCRGCNGTRLLRTITRDHLTSIPRGRDVGTLEAYACLQCGLVEWYCRDAAKVPIHPHLMTDVIDVAGDGPYR